MDRLQRIAIVSIAVALMVLVMKLVAWRMTGSVALYADALESLVNVAAAVFALAAVRYARRPPDRNHPYGHHKAEYLSAVLEGVLIVLASLAVLREAWSALQVPREMTAPLIGLATNAAAGAFNAAWGWFLIRKGRAYRSPALQADGRHLMADVVSSVGVLAGLLLAIATGFALLDGLLAAVVGVYILWAGWRLVRESLGGLMDEATSPDVADRIRDLIQQHGAGALEAHDLRTRRAGSATFIDFHLVVPSSMTVLQAHEICDRIESALKSEIGGIVPIIHVEPAHKAKLDPTDTIGAKSG